MFSSAAIVPHAGRKYAEPLRKSVFEALGDKHRHVIYLAPLHKSVTGPTKMWYQGRQRDVEQREHSFEWVSEELCAKLNACLATKTVDVFYVDASYVPDESGVREVLRKISWVPTALIVGADFTHSDGSVPVSGRQKVAYEDALITSLISSSLIGVDDALSKTPDVTCSHGALRLFTRLLEYAPMVGRVVDYYDSHAIERKATGYKKYILPPNGVSFVSYCGAVYTKLPVLQLSKFDVAFAFGLMFTAIANKLANKESLVQFPKWSPWTAMTSGVFVGTEVSKGHINSSIGRFESNDGESTGARILAAAVDCIDDSRRRWKVPITLSMLETPQFRMKIEVLESRNSWVEWPSVSAYRQAFKMDGSTGTYLTLASGRSATYLPSVSLEMKTVNEYLEHLAAKAGGTLDATGVKIYTYKSVAVYFSNDH